MSETPDESSTPPDEPSTPDKSSASRDTLSWTRVLLTRTGFVVACALLGLLIGGVIAAFTPKSYQAHAQIFATAVTDSSANANVLNSASMYAQSRVQSYTTVPTSPAVVRPVRTKLQLDLSVDALTGKISANAPLNKALLNIAVKDGSAARAARIAQAVSAQTIVEIQQLESASSTTSASTLKLTIVHPAEKPSSAISPRIPLILVVGLFGGLLFGLVIVVARERLRPLVRSAADVSEATDTDVLVEIPTTRPGVNAPDYVDSYRRLARFVRVTPGGIGGTAGTGGTGGTGGTAGTGGTGGTAIALVGSDSGDGASSVALNLSRALAESGLSTCLVDLDLGAPSIGEQFGLGDKSGVAAVLAGELELDDAVTAIDGGLSVVPAGGPTSAPGELLAGPRLRQLVQQLRERFEFVVLDGGSLLQAADGLQAVSVADQTVIVACARRTRVAQLALAAQTVTRAGATLAGVVANRVGPMWGRTARLGVRPIATPPDRPVELSPEPA